MQFFVGISGCYARVRAVCESHAVPMMLSAGALYRREGMRNYPAAMQGARVAIDSAGFSAMTVHGGRYPWSVDQYLDLVEQADPVWYASRDYCVEPSIATDDAERARRIEQTVRELGEVREVAARRRMRMPMPVLQGWHADEYLMCWEQMGRPAGLLGIGSVCRRHLRGDAGLLSILDELAANGVGSVHLFGVKGQAVDVVSSDMFLAPVVASVDSHAWDFAARMEGCRGIAEKLVYLDSWIGRQLHRQGAQP